MNLLLSGPGGGLAASAQGMLVAEHKSERSQTVSLSQVNDFSTIQARAASLAEDMAASLVEEGLNANTIFSESARLDCRFKGQSFTLPVDLDVGTSLVSVEAAFRAAHEEKYG